MFSGIIKKIDKQMGFGYITRTQDSKVIFFHFSACTNKVDGFNSLASGEEVSFDTQEGQKGLMAVDVGKI